MPISQDISTLIVHNIIDQCIFDDEEEDYYGSEGNGKTDVTSQSSYEASRQKYQQRQPEQMMRRERQY